MEPFRDTTERCLAGRIRLPAVAFLTSCILLLNSSACEARFTYSDPQPKRQQDNPKAKIGESILQLVDEAEVSGLTIRTERCDLVGETLTVTLLLANNGANDREIGIVDPKLFNREGNEYNPDTVLLADKSVDYYGRKKIVSGNSLRGTISFARFRTKADSVALLEFTLIEPYLDRRVVQFRNLIIARR